jgi:hypothetical protein
LARYITPVAAGLACVLSVTALIFSAGEERGTIVLRVVTLEEVSTDHEGRLRELEKQGRVIEGIVVEVRATRRDVERIRSILEQSMLHGGEHP